MNLGWNNTRTDPFMISGLPPLESVAGSENGAGFRRIDAAAALL